MRRLLVLRRASPALRAPLGANRLAPSSLALRARWLSSEAAVDASDAATPTEATSEVVEVAPPALPPAASNTASSSSDSYRVKMMRAMKDKEYERVLDLYDDMVNANVTPNTLTLNCLVEAKAHKQGTLAARETLKLLLAEHPTLQPSAQTYAALMRPCEVDGDTVTAFELYQEALAQPDLALHVDLFNTLISVATRAKDFKAAENIFDEMREKGVKPKSATYLKYIYACFRLQQPDKAYDMLCNMEKEWRVPDTRDYQRMHQLFKYCRHDEGKAMCVRGMVADLQVRASPHTSRILPLSPASFSHLLPHPSLTSCHLVLADRPPGGWRLR